MFEFDAKDRAEHIASSDKWIIICECLFESGQYYLRSLLRKVIRFALRNYNWPLEMLLLTAISAP